MRLLAAAYISWHWCSRLVCAQSIAYPCGHAKTRRIRVGTIHCIAGTESCLRSSVEKWSFPVCLVQIFWTWRDCPLASSKNIGFGSWWWPFSSGPIFSATSILHGCCGPFWKGKTALLVFARFCSFGSMSVSCSFCARGWAVRKEKRSWREKLWQLTSFGHHAYWFRSPADRVYFLSIRHHYHTAD